MQSGEASSIHIKQITMFNLQSSPRLLFSAEHTIASFPGRFLRGRREKKRFSSPATNGLGRTTNDRHGLGAGPRGELGAQASTRRRAGRKAHARACALFPLAIPVIESAMILSLRYN